MHELTKDFLRSMEKEEIIEYVDGLIKKRDERENEKDKNYQKLVNENNILKDKLMAIKKIVAGDMNIPATLNTALSQRTFGKE